MTKLKCTPVILRLFKNLLVGLCLIICFFYTWAEAHTDKPKTLTLGEIVITASRSEKKIQDIPAHATVINQNKMEKQSILTLDEALRYQSGLSSVMVRDPTGSSRQISLRGFRGQGRTQLLLNGHPVNGGYNGQVNWASFPISNIDRLEIVKGPYSALYGGAAMGGTIQIITKDSKKTNLYIKQLYGQDQTKGWRLHFGTRIGDQASLSLGFDHTTTNGYIDQYVVKKISTSGSTPGGGSGGGGGGAGGGGGSASTTPTSVTGLTPTQTPTGENAYLVGNKGDHWAKHQGFNTQLSFDISPSMTLKIFFMNQNSDNGFGAPHSNIYKTNGEQVWKGTLQSDQNPGNTITLFESDFLNGEIEKAKNTYHGSFVHNLTPESNYKLKAGYTDEYRNSYRQPKPKKSTLLGDEGTLSETPGTSLHIEGERQFPLGTKHKLTFGVGYLENEIEDDEWALTNWLAADTKSQRENRTEGEDETIYGFLQDEYSISQYLNLLAGLRYDRWQSKGLQIDALHQTTHFDKQNEDNYSPRLGLSYRPLPETQIRTALGTAFRTPPIQALYRTTESPEKTTQMNPQLEAEKTFSWEVGIDQQFTENIGLRLTYFENTIKDMIYPRLIDTGTTPDTYLRENAGKGHTRGIESELEYQLTSWLTWWGNYTYQEAKIKENSAAPESEGKRVPLVPWVMGNVGLDFNIADFHTSLVGHYKGKVYKRDDNSDYMTDVFGAYDSYFIVNAKVSYTLVKYLKLSLAVDNLFDRTYYENNKAPGKRLFGEISYIY